MAWSLLQPRATKGSVIEPEEFDFSLPVITLDANLVETHRLKANLSQYPIERSPEGENRITDHIEMEPDFLVLEGIITNTPLADDLVALQRAQSPEVEDRYRKTYAELERLMRRGTVFSVTSTLKLYRNMVITEVSTAKRGNPGFQDVRPKITFEKATFVDTAVVPVPANILKPPPPDPPNPPPSSDTSAQTEQNLEKQSKTDADDTLFTKVVKAGADLWTSTD